MKSPTNAFEDAEIAREEARTMAAVIMYAVCGVDLDAGSSGTLEAIRACRVADALISLGYSRQSPASTTAADAWDEGYMAVPAAPENREWFVEDAPNPYRVAAPEGDGGNE